MASVKAESDANVAYHAAMVAVIEAARRLRKARADWDLGCPDSLTPYYAALNAALDKLDAMEARS
jgi:hypothetical protein